MVLSRRDFLWQAGAGLLLPLSVHAQGTGSTRFRHGVASGDPLADRVILWTRVTPPTVLVAAAPPVDVRWTVATDPALARVVTSGSVRTSADRDFTVKVDAAGLEPGTTYYYAFTAAGERSVIGRTRTLPPAGTTRVRLALAACSNYPAGFFHAYGRIAARDDLDAVVHLGDYIYEYENGYFGDGTELGRIPQPNQEIVSLADYRLRYSVYRTDPDLQEAHRQHPFIVVWDDHELADNASREGAVNHQPDTEGTWAARKAAAYRAYLEWLPIREQAGPDIRLYRSFRFGTLADLIMLDTRALRDLQVSPNDLAALERASRSMLGSAQERWLHEQLRASARAETAWRLLGQQVIFSRLSPPGRAVGTSDPWDGYPATRDRILDLLETERIRDVAILSGDIHSAWGNDIPRNPWSGYAPRNGAGSLAVEFVTPAVSSSPLFWDGRAEERAAALMQNVPSVRYMDGGSNGYTVVDITPDRLQADWYFVGNVWARAATERFGGGMVCERGTSHLERASAPAAPADRRPAG